MFDIYLNKLKLFLKGCPQSGLAAIDWRRSHNVPDGPSSLLLTFDPPSLTNEGLCRSRPELLDDDADLRVECLGLEVEVEHVPALEEMVKLSRENTWPETLPPHWRAALVAIIQAVDVTA